MSASKQFICLFVLVILLSEISFAETWGKMRIPFGKSTVTILDNGIIGIANTMNSVFITADKGKTWIQYDNKALLHGIRGTDRFYFFGGGHGEPFLNITDTLGKNMKNILVYDSISIHHVFNLAVGSENQIYVFAIEYPNTTDYVSKLYYTSDKGLNWKLTAKVVPNFTKVISNKDAILYAIHSRWGFYKSVDQGRNWRLILNGITSDNFSSIVETNQGELIISANKGKLFKSTDKGESWYSLTNVFPENIFLRELKIMPSGNMYLVARDINKNLLNQTVQKSTDNGITWTQIGDAITCEYQIEMVITPDESVILSLDGVLYSNDPSYAEWIDTDNSWSVYAVPAPQLTPVKTIAIDSSDNKWIGTDVGLYKFDGVNTTEYNVTNSGLPGNLINSIHADKNGEIWIGTSNGLAKFDGINWMVYNRENSGIQSDTILAIAEDKKGSKWIGTSSGGMVNFDGTHWIVYNKSNSKLPYNKVLSIAIDADDNKWIGTKGPYNFGIHGYEGGGLTKFDGTNWIIYNTSNSKLPKDIVASIIIDRNGNKWLLSAKHGPYDNDLIGGGLTKFDGTNWRNYNSQDVGSNYLMNHVVTMTIDKNDIKWLISGPHLIKFDGLNWTIYDETHSQLYNSHISMAIDRKDNKWIGTRDRREIVIFNEGGVVPVERNEEENLIKSFTLFQNYPNPFNPNTTIEYSLSESQKVELKVYDSMGSEIVELVNDFKEAGKHSVNFNAGNLASGIYFYRIKTGSMIETKKLILLK